MTTNFSNLLLECIIRDLCQIYSDLVLLNRRQDCLKECAQISWEQPIAPQDEINSEAETITCYRHSGMVPEIAFNTAQIGRGLRREPKPQDSQDASLLRTFIKQRLQVVLAELEAKEAVLLQSEQIAQQLFPEETSLLIASRNIPLVIIE